ncbi:MAG: stilbene synthase, partial [Candidatus Kapabacteria bacterium]|nr:stilbene synthase [Candidatus Kapabacteria bacterium]
MNVSPRIAAIATSNPDYRVGQEEVREYAKIVFAEHPEFLDKMLPVFTNAGIGNRFFSQPMEWFDRAHDFAEANGIFVSTATRLCTEAAQKAIGQAGISPSEISAILVATSTGIATPSIDAAVIQSCGLPRTVKRIPIWGLGCAAGVSGLARAAEITRYSDGGYVLFIAVELCSLTFQRNDLTKSNIIASSLFGDGAAAVLLSTKSNSQIAVTDSYSRLFDNTGDIMGWDMIQSGLKVRFSRDIPSFIEKNIPQVAADIQVEWGMGGTPFTHYVMHPGGTKVLDAYCIALGITRHDLRHSESVLASYGNMSSCSVLFVLEEMMKDYGANPKNGIGLMMALGP